MSVFPKEADLFVIAVGGSSKKSGKTRVASRLIQALKIDCAVKVSAGEHYFPDREIIEDPDIIRQPGTDTARYVAAGAKRVIWIDTIGANMPHAIGSLNSLCKDCETVLIESNSAIPLIRSDFTVFIAGANPSEFKESALSVVRIADLICINGNAFVDKRGNQNIFEALVALNGNAKIAWCENEEECASTAIQILNVVFGCRKNKKGPMA